MVYNARSVTTSTNLIEISTIELQIQLCCNSTYSNDFK